MKQWSISHFGIAALFVVASIGMLLVNPSTAHALSISDPARAVTPRSNIGGAVIPAIQPLSSIGPTDSRSNLSLAIALNLRNASALDALLAAQDDPGSPEYHQYLTPQQFDANFAPSQATVSAVVAFLQSQGFQIGAIAPNRLIIDATGTVAQAQHAFQIQLDNFQYAGRVVYAPTTNPSVPAALAGSILNISGLDDVATFQPRVLPLAGGRNGSGPGGGFTPNELRAAYDVTPLINSANGAGQTVAIFELDGYKAADVNAYLSQYNLGAARYTNVLVDGATTNAGSGAIEVELDMEVVSAIAPGAAQRIYIGPNSAQGLIDTYNKIVTDNIAKVTSTSWGACEANMGTGMLSALDNVYKQGAAQGQAFFAAAGDSGAYDCGTTSLGVDSPADDPNVIGVGGTNLQTGTGATYASESVWACPSCSGRGPKGTGGGGGVSAYFAQPTFQNGSGVSNAYSTGKREVPDVSADADPYSGYSVYCTAAASGCPSNNGWVEVGGTSAAAPLWAGLAADTNAYLAGLGKPTLGTANATLYHLFNTTQTYPAFHDVTSGTNLYYPSTAGFDLASGIGTPDGWNLARDAATPPAATPPGAPTLTAFTPTSGAPGTTVTITGTNLAGATSVKFNGTAASFSVVGSTKLTAIVPVGASTGAISVTIPAGSVASTTMFTVTASTTTQLLVNPGFESGLSPWLATSSGGYQSQIVNSTNPHTGGASAWLCGYAGCNDIIWQTVTLPSTTTQVVLSYWLYIDTTKSSQTCLNDLNVLLRTSSGTTISTVQTKCNANASGWTQYTFDVTKALAGNAGQQIQVAFQGTTTSTLSTNFYVDDVALNATHA